MKNFITLYVNGQQHEIHGEDVFMPLANYLRYRCSKTGTKIVCAEGDCGACTVLVKKLDAKEKYFSINSCIGLVFQYHNHHVITVEGLKYKDQFHPVQEAMIDGHGAQCGYCTPGIICSMALMAERSKENKSKIDKQKVKNYLTGNLCRCTGYDPIINAGININLKKVKLLDEQYPIKKINDHESVGIEIANKFVFIPTTLIEAIDFKNTYPDSKIVSGATDLGVLQNKRGQELVKILFTGNIKELNKIENSKTEILIGSNVKLDSIEEFVEKDFLEFSNLLHVFASPQIKNAASLVGNVANGSPIGDTIPFLMVANARLELTSIDGVREVNINDFYKGYKILNINPNEIITKVIVPKTKHQFKLFKVSLRKDLDISAVTFAAKFHIENQKIKDFDLAVGGVAATVIRVPEVEIMLKDKLVSEQLINQAALRLKDLVNPLSDVRGSAMFRKQLCHNLLIKCFKEAAL